MGSKHGEPIKSVRNGKAYKVADEMLGCLMIKALNNLCEASDLFPTFFSEREKELLDWNRPMEDGYVSEDGSGYLYLWYVTVFYHEEDNEDYTPEYFKDELKAFEE